MSTNAQQHANQQNAQHSTGPVSVDGKAASSRNAVKHGLSSAFVVLPQEDQAEFDALRTAFLTELNPTGQHEAFLVDQMIQSRWRLARIQRLETALLDQMMDGPDALSPDSCIVAAMAQKSGSTLSTLQRYAAAAERSYHKAHRELIHGRTSGDDVYIITPPPAPAPAPAGAPVPTIPQHDPKPVELPNEPKLSVMRNEPNPSPVAIGERTANGGIRLL